ncbi:MAG: hypothetical protein KDG50_01645 [Chromatiales bacterium]|nr:hypothetical protein [Chromatiales bacterium]
MSTNSLQAVAGAIARQKMIDASTIRPDTTLEELGVSSLDVTTIAFELEEEFNLSIPNEALDGLTTVADVVTRLNGLLDER